MIRFTLLILSFVLISCQTVTISPKGKTFRYSNTPDYEKPQNFFLLGLIGEAYIDTNKICGDKPVTQMQTKQSFEDGLLAIVTLGIFTRRTASVWCKNKKTTNLGRKI